MMKYGGCDNFEVRRKADKNNRPAANYEPHLEASKV
jgi:hypothetical protein